MDEIVGRDFSEAFHYEEPEIVSELPYNLVITWQF